MQLICQEPSIKTFIRSSWPELTTFRLVLLDDDRAVLVDYPYQPGSFPLGIVHGMQRLIEQIDEVADQVISAMSMSVQDDDIVIFDIESES